MQIYNLSYELYDTAQQYFSQCLEDSTEAKEYLESRGIELETARDFSLGFSPNTINGLLENLEKKFDLYDIIASGLFVTKKDYIVPFFKNRIIFPVYLFTLYS